MRTTKREIYELEGYNHDVAYNTFNELTGLDLEWEIDQDYGTDCYGIMNFNINSYPTLEELEAKIQRQLNAHNGLDFDFDEWNDSITINDIYYYLRRKGELPEADILYHVSY